MSLLVSEDLNNLQNLRAMRKLWLTLNEKLSGSLFFCVFVIEAKLDENLYKNVQKISIKKRMEERINPRLLLTLAMREAQSPYEICGSMPRD